MNEKGFATIFGLCLILVIALVVGGIQAAETNHAYETTDFQAEFELQNAADSVLVETVEAAVKRIKAGDKELINRGTDFGRRRAQYEFPAKKIPKTSEHLGDITVTVWCEEVMIQPYKVKYKSNGKNIAERNGNSGRGYFFFSRAEATVKRTGGKIYRRASAYVLSDDGYKEIHFTEVPMSDYNFKD